jgi:hypothetical protein
MTMPRPVPVFQLTPEEKALFDKFCAVCDARADGYRCGMEHSKQMFVQFLILQRKQENG